MEQIDSDKLLKEIEYLRDQMNDYVKENKLDDDLLRNKEILQISKQLDILITKYMSQK